MINNLSITSVAVDGDLPGHPFHGNQHMMGEAAVKHPTEGSRARNMERVKAIVAAEAKRQGFPAHLIKVLPGEAKFSVNGKNFKAAGLFHHATGTVSIYADAITDHNKMQIKDIVSHEIGHAIFQKEIVGQAHAGSSFAKHMANKEVLEKNDGVTSYSRSYWKGLKAGTNTYNAALHETFAEVHALHSTNPKEFDRAVKPAWKEFYADVMKASKVGVK